MAVKPIITYPTENTEFSTNLKYLTLQGTCNSNTKEIKVNGSTDNVTYVIGSTTWSYYTPLNEGENILQVTAVDNSDQESDPAVITAIYTKDESLQYKVPPPTGISLERGINYVKVSVTETHPDNNIVVPIPENTKLLINCDNVSPYEFTDSSTKNEQHKHKIVNVNNVESTIKKAVPNFDKSAYFDGTSYLISPTSNDWYMPFDFTIDLWLNLSSINSEKIALIQQSEGLETNIPKWYLYLDYTDGVPKLAYYYENTRNFSPSDVNGDRITINAHGFSENTKLMFEAAQLKTINYYVEGALPKPLDKSIVYYVSIVDTNTIKLKTSEIGTPITFTTQGIGLFTVIRIDQLYKSQSLESYSYQVIKNFNSYDVDPNLDTITLINHNLALNDKIKFDLYSITESLPGGIVRNVTYYVYPVDTNTIRLKTSLNNNQYLDITDQGNGSFKLTLLKDFFKLNPFELDSWHHFALTKNSNILNFWFDGKKVGQEAMSVPIEKSDAPLYIGKGEAFTTSNFHGYMDEIHISKDIAIFTEEFIPNTYPYGKESIENKLEITGYNFYGSEYPGGGLSGYALLNSSVVKDPSFYKDNIQTIKNKSILVGDIKETNITEKITRENYYSYTHDRSVQPLGTNPLNEPNYYVSTAIAYDTENNRLLESPYSDELGNSPLILDATLKSQELRTTLDVQRSYIGNILSINPLIDVKPGTISRDIHINPPSDEFERLYIIEDFRQRSQSFLTLLEFDDENGDGESDPVMESLLKKRLKDALLISDDNADQVQLIIDDAFTKLAGNVNKPRKQPQKAIGRALFFTKQKPTYDITVNSGAIIQTDLDDTGSVVQFTVLTNFILPITDLENYYNREEDRYEQELDIEALLEGSSGNQDAGKITKIVSGADSLFGVININPTQFGENLESNRKLAERAMLAFGSVDAGTESGYLSNTLETPNVERTKVITAGDPLMQRDVDPLRKVHLHGMVDIYLQGSKEAEYEDTFGFTYDTIREQTAIIQSVPFFQFKMENSNISTDFPIYDIIEIVNVSKGLSNYDTTGFRIIGNGNVIDLDETLPNNISIGLDPTDIVKVSYRFRNANPYIFNNQPVKRIVSVSGNTSGILSSNNYILQKPEEPLGFGSSTLASDQMVLKYYNGVPLGAMVTVTNEEHILTEEAESLGMLGIDTDTIVVKDKINPLKIYELDIDYSILPVVSTLKSKTYVQIKKLEDGSITSGSAVLVDYEAGENFTVSYTVNSLLQTVQDKIDIMKHLTADTVIKEALETKIDFDIFITIFEGSNSTVVDRNIRSAVAKVLANKKIGENIYQSDIVGAVENVEGVNYVQIPIKKMTKADDSIVLRELLLGFNPYGNVDNKIFKSSKLAWPTIANGSNGNMFSGVFDNDIIMTPVDTLNDLVSNGQAYIDLNGYVYICVTGGEKYISEHTFTVTYMVKNPSTPISKDILVSDSEYCSVGNLLIEFATSKKVTGF